MAVAIGPFAIRNDHRIGSALPHAESLDVHAFVAHAHASEAKDAARRVVIDDVGPLDLGHVQLFFDKTAAVRAVPEGHILQFAFAALVTNGTIQGMIGEQKFQHGFARFVHLRRIRAHHHAVHGYQRARGLQLGRLLDFDETHAAGGLQRETPVIAERRHLDALLPRRFNDQSSGRHRQFAVVELELYFCSFRHVLEIIREPKPALPPADKDTCLRDVPRIREATF